MRALLSVACSVLVATGVALHAMSAAAQQTTFPNRPIRLVVGIATGSQADALARLVSQKMSEGFGQSVVVDNRPCASGALAAGMVAKAAPDGYTLLYSVGFAISAAVQPNLPYDPFKDFTGVAHLGYGTQLLMVAPTLGVKSTQDLIALAKAQPGKIVFGSSAVGTGTHLSGARFAHLAGIKVATVAFKSGSESLLQTIAGRTHYCILTLVIALPFIQDGRLLPLAVMLPQRAPALPDVPTLAETLPEFKRPDVSSGLLAPAGTPRAVVNRINAEVGRALASPDMKERFSAGGFHAQPTTPAEYDKMVRAQIETLSQVARDIGLRSK